MKIIVTFQCDDYIKVHKVMSRVEDMGGSIVTNDNKEITQLALLESIKRVTGATLEDMKGKCRKYHIVAARAILASVLCHYGMTHTEVGVIISKDHSSITHHVGEFHNRVLHDNRFRYLVCKVMYDLDLYQPMLGITEEQCEKEIQNLSLIYEEQ